VRVEVPVKVLSSFSLFSENVWIYVEARRREIQAGDTLDDEYGAATFVNIFSTNRIEAGAQIQITVSSSVSGTCFLFGKPVPCVGGAKVVLAELNYTDDRGNQATVTVNP